jgi:3-oxoacyl-(acyl-carrier-protein) synthase
VQFDVVTGSAREVGLRAAVNDSFGFSGHNVALGLCCEWAWRSVGWPTRSL